MPLNKHEVTPGRAPGLLAGWRPAGWLCLAVGAVYGQTLGFSFLDWDDVYYVTDNDHVRHGVTIAGLAWLPTGVIAYSWHPLTNLALMIDATLYGSWAGGFHLTNALLHAACAVVAWRVLLALTGRAGLAFAAALLFAVHPLRVESVAWIAQRKDLVFGVFALLGLLAYCRYDERRGVARFAWVTLAVLAAALSKPVAIVVPLLCGLIDVYRAQRRAGGESFGAPLSSPARRVAEKLPWLAIAALPAAAMYFRHASSGAVLMPFSGSAVDRAAFVFLSLSEYLRLSVWPSGQMFLHPMWPSYPALGAVASGGLVIGLTALAWWGRSRCPEALFGWLFFLVAVLPAAGVVRVGAHFIAERYTYLPHVGLMLAAAALAARTAVLLERAGRLLPWATGAVAGSLAAAATVYAWTWRDSESLYLRALAVDPTHLTARVNLASVYGRAGNRERALSTLEPLRLSPASGNDPEVAFNLAKSYSALRREAWAEQWFARSVELSPEVANVWMARASHRLDRRQYAGAAEDFEVSLKLRPDFRFALVGLGYAQFHIGRPEEAKAALVRAAQLDPTWAEPHFHLGVIAEAQGNVAGAHQHYADALKRNPWHAPTRRRSLRLGAPSSAAPG